VAQGHALRAGGTRAAGGGGLTVAVATLTDQVIELPGGRSQVAFRGGDGAPLVFLHAGGGLDPGDPLLAELARSHTIVAPVAPGFADLGDLDAIRDVHELAMHYDDFFEALGLEGVPVIGHSFGGMVAAELAAHYPRRVSALVLIAPVGLWHDDYPVADVFATLPTELPALLFADTSHPAAQAMLVGADGEPDVEALVPIVRGLTTLAKFMWPIPDRGLSRRLRRIAAPTLLVWGEQDTLVPARYADDFVEGMPQATTAIIPGAGHLVTIERPEQVLAAIQGFLDPGDA
jgi:pimeloyl-ACP methyl ester carboxylesterase